MVCDCSILCADRGIFVSLTKKLWRFLFVFLFFSPQLIIQKSNGQFQRNLSFSRFQRGSIIFQGGGVQLFPGGGGVHLLIPYRNPYNLWFSRGVRTPCPPPLDPHLHFLVMLICLFLHRGPVLWNLNCKVELRNLWIHFSLAVETVGRPDWGIYFIPLSNIYIICPCVIKETSDKT